MLHTYRKLEDRIRREVGDENLSIAWLPNEPCEALSSTDDVEGLGAAMARRRGCWAVMETHRYLMRGEFCDTPICWYRRVKRPIFVLNGRGDTPAKPGPWLIALIKNADLRRHGLERIRELDLIRQKIAAAERKQAHDQVHETVRGNKSMFKIFKKSLDEMGMPDYSREELVAFEKEAISLAQDEEDEFQKLLKTRNVII